MFFFRIGVKAQATYPGFFLFKWLSSEMENSGGCLDTKIQILSRDWSDCCGVWPQEEFSFLLSIHKNTKFQAFRVIIKPSRPGQYKKAFLPALPQTPFLGKVSLSSPGTFMLTYKCAWHGPHPNFTSHETNRLQQETIFSHNRNFQPKKRRAHFRSLLLRTNNKSQLSEEGISRPSCLFAEPMWDVEHLSRLPSDHESTSSNAKEI